MASKSVKKQNQRRGGTGGILRRVTTTALVAAAAVAVAAAGTRFATAEDASASASSASTMTMPSKAPPVTNTMEATPAATSAAPVVAPAAAAAASSSSPSSSSTSSTSSSSSPSHSSSSSLQVANSEPSSGGAYACDPSKNKPVSSEFVKTSGTKFTLGGKPWYFGGTNAVYLTNGPDFPESDISEFFCVQANQGARVVRVAAYLNGFGCHECTKTPNPIQPRVGVFNEATLQRLDKMVASAKANGIRLIMTLGNFEDQWGGMQWYVDEVLGSGGASELSGGDKHLFYVDPRVKNAYKNYARTIVTRRNTITGVAYADEPAILGWEVLNEPHTKDEYERNGGAVCRDTPGGCVPGKLAYTWIAEMSAYIKSLDDKHLVSTGEEGYRADGDSSCCHNNWINGGFKGEDFTKNTALPTIDFATIHVYPDHWQIEPNEYTWIGPNYIADRAKVAHSFNKPIIMEEYGMENGYMARDDLLSYLTRIATENDVAGSLVWAVWSKNVPRVTCSGCSYDFQYGDEGTRAMTEYFAKMNGLSAASGSAALQGASSDSAVQAATVNGDSDSTSPATDVEIAASVDNAVNAATAAASKWPTTASGATSTTARQAVDAAPPVAEDAPDAATVQKLVSNGVKDVVSAVVDAVATEAAVEAKEEAASAAVAAAGAPSASRAAAPSSSSSRK